MENQKMKMRQEIQSRQKARQLRSQRQHVHFDYEKYYNTPADFTYLKSHNYKIVKEISRGGFGVVYKAYGLDENGIMDKEKKFAIKIIFSTINPEMIVGEIAVLKLIQGKENVIQLIDCFSENQSFHLVFDYFKYDPFIVIQTIIFLIYQCIFLRNFSIQQVDWKSNIICILYQDQ